MSHFRHLRLRSKVHAYVDGELDETAARGVRAHLSQCWWCSGDAQTHLLVRAALLRRRDRVTSLPLARLRRFVRDTTPADPILPIAFPERVSDHHTQGTNEQRENSWSPTT